MPRSRASGSHHGDHSSAVEHQIVVLRVVGSNPTGHPLHKKASPLVGGAFLCNWNRLGFEHTTQSARLR